MSTNRRYLLSLDPERLLHNFYASAGLSPPRPTYGGWESTGIAGHTLGHWLSAASLFIANGGDSELSEQLDHTLDQMARIQAAHGDGYIGGTSVWRAGKTIDGKTIFEELRRREIDTTGGALNGGWAPIYAWHKVHAGVLDAHRLAGNSRALPIALGMASYLGTIFDQLSDEHLQKVLEVEHGGICETFAELFALTNDRRWLTLAERLRHNAVFEPLARREDPLAGLHANTQIPKLVGIARLHELTGNASYGAAARYFHDTVVNRYSYVIGGNSEKEHFGSPGQLQGTLTTATCESCNSYNMLKLTRHLFEWSPQGSLFDYYERTQLNHILAHQRPDDGRFAYFIPLAPGSERIYSQPENSFWCCVGTGMESHAKHADSIYWHDLDSLYVNLYIPSVLDWPERGLRLSLDTRYPMDGAIRIAVEQAPRRTTTLALRIPGWTSGATIKVNGKPQDPDLADGYARIARRWSSGDRIELNLPMRLRAETLPGDTQVVAFLSGPLVLAADMGPAGEHVEDPMPALISDHAIGSLRPVDGAPHRFRLTTVQGRELELKPFFPLYDRRAAVYFRAFTTARWELSKDKYYAEEEARVDLLQRTVDILHIGEPEPEREHAVHATGGWTDIFYGRHNRHLPEGESMRFQMARSPGLSVLQITYFGRDIDRTLEISVDGKQIAVERRAGPSSFDWVKVDYALPPTTEERSAFELKAVKGTTSLYDLRLIRLEQVAGIAQNDSSS